MKVELFVRLKGSIDSKYEKIYNAEAFRTGGC